MYDLRSAFLSATLGVAALAIGLAAGSAKAGCNIPPPASQALRGAIGTVDRPFGRPDSPVPIPTPDPRNVEMGSNPCVPTQLDDENYVVTVIFKPPPRGGNPNIVALTAASDCSALSCDGGESYHCVSGATADLFVSTADDTLRFRFPDTDGFLGPAGDGRTFTGPALIAVTPSTDPLPCKLASQRCQDPSPPPNLFACVDELFTAGSCGTARSDLDPTFSHFVALPPMNNWAKICDKEKPPCLDEGEYVRFAVDKNGDLFQPVSWVQLGSGKWSVKGRTSIRAHSGVAKPVRITSDKFLSSFRPEGRPPWAVKPLFQPDPMAPPGWLSLCGETDKPESVLRFSRRELWAHQCQGGDHDGQACHPHAPGYCGTAQSTAKDCGKGTCVPRATPSYFACVGGSGAGSYCTQPGDCPDGGQCLPGSTCLKVSSGAPTTPCNTDLDCAADEECGVGLFEFRDQKWQGVGPFEITDPKYKAEAEPSSP